MPLLFACADPDGGSIDVKSCYSWFPTMVTIFCEDEDKDGCHGVRLSRQQVAEMRDALTAWLASEPEAKEIA